MYAEPPWQHLYYSTYTRGVGAGWLDQTLRERKSCDRDCAATATIIKTCCSISNRKEYDREREGMSTQVRMGAAKVAGTCLFSNKRTVEGTRDRQVRFRPSHGHGRAKPRQMSVPRHAKPAQSWRLGAESAWRLGGRLLGWSTWTRYLLVHPPCGGHTSHSSSSHELVPRPWRVLALLCNHPTCTCLHNQ